MNKRHGIFGFTVIILAVMFTLIGCENGTTDTKEWDEFFVDTYTHASQQYAIAALPGTGAVLSKTILEGDDYNAAVQFIHDYSHYLYVERNATGFFGWPYFKTDEDKAKYNTNWRSAIGGAKPYGAPAGDPACREVKVLSINPNGSITASHGSYWGMALPEDNERLKNLDISNAYGWEPSDKPQPFIYFSHGQTTQNLIDRHRGTLAIDARGSEKKPYSIERARYFFVEVKLRSYEQRRPGPEGLYDGMYPGGNAMSFRELMTQATGKTLLSAAEFWGVATPSPWAPDVPVHNLASDEERAAYIAELKADADVMKVFASYGPDYLWFDIMQITMVSEDLNWQFTDIPGYVYDYQPRP
jgi:hypothetical protein